MTKAEEQIRTRASRKFLLLFISMAGLLYLIFDAGTLLSDSRFPISSSESFLLLCSSMAVSLIFAIVLSFPLGLIRIQEEHLSWMAFVIGFSILFSLDLAETMTRKDPNFFRNLSIPIWICIILAVSTIIFLALRPPAQKVKIGIILFLSFSLAGQMTRLPGSMSQNVPAGKSPNVILITVDAARMDVFEEAIGKLPAFSRIAAEGVKFTKAYSQIPESGPSHASILSGIPPWSHGVMKAGVALPESLPSMSRRFFSMGYRTGAFVGSSSVDAELGFDEGFEVYDDDFGQIRAWPDSLWGRWLSRFYTPAVSRDGESSLSRAFNWVENLKLKRPFFLWLNFFEPHAPYAPIPPWDIDHYDGDPYDPGHTSMPPFEKIPHIHHERLKGVTDLNWMHAQYRGEISAVDAQLQRLLSWLDQKDLSKNTLLIFCGAYGESFGEDDLWFDHGESLDEASLRVPLVLRFPTVIPAGRVVSEPVELIDLAPTVFDLLATDPLPVWPKTSAQDSPRFAGRSVAESIYTGKAKKMSRAVSPSGKISILHFGQRHTLEPDQKLPQQLSADPRALLMELRRAVNDHDQSSPVDSLSDRMEALGRN